MGRPKMRRFMLLGSASRACFAKAELIESICRIGIDFGSYGYLHSTLAVAKNQRATTVASILACLSEDYIAEI